MLLGMLLHCLWAAALLPQLVVGQTYYINFVFNNNQRYRDDDDRGKSIDSISKSSEDESHRDSTDERQSWEVSSDEVGSYQVPQREPNVSFETNIICRELPSNTDEDQECEEYHQLNTRKPKKNNNYQTEKPTKTTASKGSIELTTKSSKAPKLPIRTTTSRTTRTTTTTPKTTTELPQMGKDDNKDFDIDGNNTPRWSLPTPHPPEFFDYPQAKCHQEMDVHELFGVSLARDRGIPSKVLCEFRNDWGGPWLLMTRIELPIRIHVRHWYFGYVTDDYKDTNMNFLALAHIINNMRLAMLIIGQDNNNQLVYNLYDDFVISGFNDLFMLRKANLIEANTTDLLFTSVGEVLVSDAGHNRSCPLRVMGAWWGPKWGDFDQGYCVFPVERNIHRPGYIAIFIKPSPFEANNTAFYDTEITTRRPWAATTDPKLMEQAKYDPRRYNMLRMKDFNNNKKKVKDELLRRRREAPSIEAERKNQQKMDKT